MQKFYGLSLVELLISSLLGSLLLSICSYHFKFTAQEYNEQQKLSQQNHDIFSFIFYLQQDLKSLTIPQHIPTACILPNKVFIDKHKLTLAPVWHKLPIIEYTPTRIKTLQNNAVFIKPLDKLIYVTNDKCQQLFVSEYKNGQIYLSDPITLAYSPQAQLWHISSITYSFKTHKDSGKIYRKTHNHHASALINHIKSLNFSTQTSSAACLLTSKLLWLSPSKLGNNIVLYFEIPIPCG